jgi:hypothetical protein
MDNLIPLAADTLRYSSPLTLDVCAFTLVDRLRLGGPGSGAGEEGGRERVLQDGVTPAGWLTALAALTGMCACVSVRMCGCVCTCC